MTGRVTMRLRHGGQFSENELVWGCELPVPLDRTYPYYSPVRVHLVSTDLLRSALHVCARMRKWQVVRLSSTVRYSYFTSGFCRKSETHVLSQQRVTGMLSSFSLDTFKLQCKCLIILVANYNIHIRNDRVHKNGNGFIKTCFEYYEST